MRLFELLLILLLPSLMLALLHHPILHSRRWQSMTAIGMAAERVVSSKDPNGLLEFVMARIDGANRKQAKVMLKHGILVNGTPQTKFDFPLSVGDVISVQTGTYSKGTTTTISSKAGDAPRQLVVYEDEHILVADKPSGLLTVATDGGGGGDKATLHAKLDKMLMQRSRREKSHVVHRLDRDTSGLIIFAKSVPIKSKLQKQWQNFTKEYICICQGCIAPVEGTFESYFDESQPKVKSINNALLSNYPDARLARTHYRVLEISDTSSCSNVRVSLDTGRRNQIRVHFSDIGHPLVGDEKYSAAAKTTSQGVRTKQKQKPASSPRLMLHACSLTFLHPVTEAPLSFTSMPPAVFDRVMGKTARQEEKDGSAT